MRGLVLAGLVALARADAPPEPGFLPAWFWDPPESAGVETAVGYSLPHIPSERTFDEAFRDAAMRLFTDRRVRISGEEGTVFMDTLATRVGSTLAFDADTAGFAVFSAALVRLDSVRTPEMCVVLLGTGSLEVDRRATLSPPDRDAPSVEPVGFGDAPIYYHLSSSWMEAERGARVDLARAVFSRVRGVEYGGGPGRVKVVVSQTAADLRGVRTVKRRWDRAGGVVMVWVTGRAVGW